MRVKSIFFMAVVLSICNPLCASELPVSRVALFNSGVGYFEHTGTVVDDSQIQLRFHRDQINDLLKSLVVNDFDGGRVAEIIFGAKTNVAHALKSFSVDLTQSDTLRQLLGQLRGQPVKIMTPEPIEGKIVQVETRPDQLLKDGQPVTLQRDFITLMTANGLQTWPLDTLTAVTPTAPVIQQDLEAALAVLADATERDQRPVTFLFEGRGERRVRIGYVVEAPVWQVSYRLDLGADPPHLQGWAIVENSSDNDWRQARLDLVSGRPISFVQDLYTARFLPRPVVEPEGFKGLSPQLHEEGVLASTFEAKLDRAAAPGQSTAAAPEAQSMDRSDRAHDLSPNILPGVTAAADTAMAGEQFVFSIQNPVNLPRRQNAMFPIVSSAIAVESISLYNAETLLEHPLSGAWITNDTGLHLPAGPVTVYTAGVYDGDASLPHMVPDDRRFISYAIDLATTVDATDESKNQLVTARLVEGVFEEVNKTIFTRTYTFKNKSDQPKTIIAEHPFDDRRQLVEPEKFLEKTDRWYRFSVPLAAKETTSLNVREEQHHQQRIFIGDMPLPKLEFYASQEEMPEPVRAALVEIIAQRRNLSQLETTDAQLQQQMRAIASDQQRLRENLQSTGSQSALGKRYLQKLAQQEDRIEALAAQADEVEGQILQARDALAKKMTQLNIE